MKFFVILTVATLILAACQPTAEQLQPYVEQTVSALPTQTAYATGTAYPTYTIYPTYTLANTATARVVTATHTASPMFTKTPTNTPTQTAIPTATLSPLKRPHGDGFYLIGSSIAPGVWKSSGTGDRCYWAVTTKTGDIIKNHYGMAGGTAYIPAGGFQVEFSQCGTWTWLSD